MSEIEDEGEVGTAHAGTLENLRDARERGNKLGEFRVYGLGGKKTEVGYRFGGSYT